MKKDTKWYKDAANKLAKFNEFASLYLILEGDLELVAKVLQLRRECELAVNNQMWFGHSLMPIPLPEPEPFKEYYPNWQPMIAYKPGDLIRREEGVFIIR